MEGNRLQELRELIEFLKANEIAEFDMEREDLKVRIKFAAAAAPAMPGAGIDLAHLSRLMTPAQAPMAAPPVHAAAPTAEPIAEALHMVKSPIVGTFYESASPGTPPFVAVGDQVEVGQVLCIVEAMKLMNEIESDVAGEVVQRIAVSGQPVEYGQPLFSIKPR
jgi:acetyl-CoA carboxylase biotin carboxyl carrier protein